MSTNAAGERFPLPAYALLFGGAILTLLFLIVAMSEAGWLLGIPIHGFVLPAALLGSCLVTGWGARNYFRRPLRIALVVAVFLALLVIASAWISLAFYDVSFDGQAYHQEGVYQLAHGWNPLFSPYISPIETDQDVKLVHFAKGPWIIGAAMYSLTGRIETGKFANLPLTLAAFALALAVFAGSGRKPSAWAVAMSALVAANPVALTQIFTFYVDGQMASLLACLAALCWLSATGGNPWLDLLLFEAAVLTIQVKFTGLVYVTIFLAGFIALLAWQKRDLRRPLYVAFLALGLGTCVIGKNPYVSNTLENGHPFYPFFGHGDFARITMTKATPPEFLNGNRALNLVASLASRSNNWPPQSALKSPWQINRNEWAAFSEPDVIVGGFGPLFPAALVLSLALLAMALWKGGATPRLAAAIILIVVLSVLPVSAGWWARYAPQVWLVPLLALAPLGGAMERQVLRRLSWLVLVLLTVNAAGTAVANTRANLVATQDAEAALTDLRSRAPFKIAFGHFRALRFRLQEAGIPFVEEEHKLKCEPEVKEADDLCIEPEPVRFLPGVLWRQYGQRRERPGPESSWSAGRGRRSQNCCHRKGRG